MPRFPKNRNKLIGEIRQRVFDKFDNSARTNRRRIYRLALAGFSVFLFVTLFIGDTGLFHITQMHLEKRSLKKENHELLVKLIDADMIRDRLKNDPHFIEHIARTRHFMSRPGEVIYRFK